jgi:hypothetical protein
MYSKKHFLLNFLEYILIYFIKYSNCFKYFTKSKNTFTLKVCSSVDRASDSDSESQGFDSLHAYVF